MTSHHLGNKPCSSGYVLGYSCLCVCRCVQWVFLRVPACLQKFAIDEGSFDLQNDTYIECGTRGDNVFVNTVKMTA